MTKNDYKFFEHTKNISLLSDRKRIHIGCIAVYKGYVIGIGYNTNKTHPIQKYYNKYRNSWNVYGIKPTLHAEINCINSIRHLDINFSKVKLYIYRTCCNEKLGMCRPCPSCIAAIKDIGIKNIYYTTNEGYCYENI